MGKKENGEEMINKSKELLDNIPFWAEKATQLYLPIWHL